MIDKIKVNLSFFVYNTLLQDMIRFECFKPNGDVNRNDFLNCVICNFYDNKIQKRERLQKQLSSEAILTDVSEKNKKKMLDAATKIMDDFYNEDLSYRSHPFSFMIYPTKRTQTFFDSLYENEIRSKDSLSSFIRRLLNEYVFLPQYVRESVVKRHEYVELYQALKNENVVLLSVSGREYRIAWFEPRSEGRNTHLDPAVQDFRCRGLEGKASLHEETARKADGNPRKRNRVRLGRDPDRPDSRQQGSPANDGIPPAQQAQHPPKGKGRLRGHLQPFEFHPLLPSLRKGNSGSRSSRDPKENVGFL